MTEPAPGSVGEEAAKLLDALQDWARGMTQGHGGVAAEDPPADGREAPRSGMADGSAACRLCPLCQLIAALRHTRPETFAHLLEASAALTAALRSMVEAGAGHAHRHSGVERIDLDPPGDAAAAPG